MKLIKSKLGATSFFGKKISHIISSENFQKISKILGTWHSIQVHYLERAKNQQVLGKLL
jgi:hypothetical protein